MAFSYLSEILSYYRVLPNRILYLSQRLGTIKTESQDRTDVFLWKKSLQKTRSPQTERRIQINQNSYLDSKEFQRIMILVSELTAINGILQI